MKESRNFLQIPIFLQKLLLLIATIIPIFLQKLLQKQKIQFSIFLQTADFFAKIVIATKIPIFLQKKFGKVLLTDKKVLQKSVTKKCY